MTGAVVFAPLGFPVLPPDALARYAAFLGVVPQIEKGEGKRSDLPQWFADRFGWPELVDQVTRIYLGLPEEERSRAILVAPSYGQAGALELLGRGLPPVFSGHNTYFLWGLAQAPKVDAEVEEVAVHRCRYCMRWRDHMAIHVARGPVVPLAEVWPRLKHFQ